MSSDIAFAASVLPDAFTEVPYLAAIPFYGSATAITACSVASGSLPAGLVLSSTYAVISGTIAYNAADGPYSFTISLTDSSGTASQAFTLNVHYLEADPDLTTGMFAILRDGPPNPGPGLAAALAALAAAEAASLPVPAGTAADGTVPVATGTGETSTWGVPSPAGIASEYLSPAVVSLAYASTVLVNAAAGNDFRLPLTGSAATIGTPANPADGQVIKFQLTQGSGGSFTAGWSGAFDFGAAGVPTLSTTPGDTDIIGFVYNAAKAKWLCLGAALGF